MSELETIGAAAGPGAARKRRTGLAGRARRVLWLAPLGLGAVAQAPLAHAQGYAAHEGRVGVVAEADVEYGGDDVLHVYYSDGSASKVSGGQGVTLSVGAHYRPAVLPVDFALTAGYKFVGTEDHDTDLGLYRAVFKFTGTYQLPGRFWVDAGPVWHVATKLKGDGYVPDIDFGDALGVTAGFGWRFLGVSYTHIRYHSTDSLANTDIDGSNIGVNLVFKF